MPLHPTVVAAPIVLAWLLAAFDLHRWRAGGGPVLPLVLNVLLLAGALTASLTGQAAAGAVPGGDAVKPLLASHDAWATGVSFLAGGTLLVRLGTWRSRDRRIPPVLAILSLLVALGLLATAHLGGRLVFEHGLGVAPLPR